MRARFRIIAPLALAVALTAACGESGSSGTDDGGSSGDAASGEACAPVAGDQLVVLEDDEGLQNADNIIPAVNAAAAGAYPALLPALNAVSAALTTEDLIELNAAVDVERQSAEDVAAGWVEESGVTEGLEQGSGAIVVGGGDFTESTVLATIYADVLTAAGFDATVQEVGNRELYLQALQGRPDPGLPGVPVHGDRVPRGRRHHRRSPPPTSTRPSRRSRRWPRRTGSSSGSRRRRPTRTRSPSPRSSPTSSA